MSYSLSHLEALEAEAVHILREVAAERERPVLLFSGGKDSIVLLRLAEKAFRPGRFPFPVLHIDTGHNFPEVIAFRDRRVAELGERLIVAKVQDTIDAGRATDETGPRASRNRLQTTTLLDAIAEHRFDAAFGGARRDEERARAKERVVSHRDEFGQWDPKHQRPELWSLYNTRLRQGEHLRVFPISNWTEMDVWQYVARERLELPAIYFAHDRQVFLRDGLYYSASEHITRADGEEVFTETVRFRTVGDMTITGATKSTAASLDEVIAEIATATVTEPAPPAPTTASPKPPWRTARRRATSDPVTVSRTSCGSMGSIRERIPSRLGARERPAALSPRADGPEMHKEALRRYAVDADWRGDLDEVRGMLITEERT